MNIGSARRGGCARRGRAAAEHRASARARGCSGAAGAPSPVARVCLPGALGPCVVADREIVALIAYLRRLGNNLEPAKREQKPAAGSEGESLARRLAGSAHVFSQERGPLASLNFVTAHDRYALKAFDVNAVKVLAPIKYPWNLMAASANYKAHAEGMGVAGAGGAAAPPPAAQAASPGAPVSYTHLRAHETVLELACRLLLEKKKTNKASPHTPLHTCVY